jgi:uncharacterized protein (DUF1501 family)
MDRQRRNLIKTGLAAIPVMVLNPGVFWHNLASVVSNSPTTSRNRVLIIIQLAGGADGLNIVVPYNNSLYYQYRPDIAIPKDQVLPLDNEIGLNPGLAKLKTLWDQGMMAIVEGAGYPNPNYSHFSSMNIWQTADPSGRAFSDGWLGRYLNKTSTIGKDIFAGLAVNSRLPFEMYSATTPVPVVASISSYQFQGDALYPTSAAQRTQNAIGLYDGAPQEAMFAATFDSTIHLAYNSIQSLQQADKSYKTTVTYPATSLGAGLRLLAEAITGDLGLRVGHVTLGGFDTHTDENTTLSKLLTTFSDAVSIFYQDLQFQSRDRDVIVMTWSEFGRRAKSNASNGTDHGSAGPVFILGSSVAGGRFGKPCDLSNVDSGNLRFTTDFRDIYATILEQWLGVPAGAVLGSYQYKVLPITFKN